MERLEEAQARLESLTSQAAATDRRLADLVDARDTKTAEFDAQIAGSRPSASRSPPTCLRT